MSPSDSNVNIAELVEAAEWSRLSRLDRDQRRAALDYLAETGGEFFGLNHNVIDDRIDAALAALTPELPADQLESLFDADKHRNFVQRVWQRAMADDCGAEYRQAAFRLLKSDPELLQSHHPLLVRLAESGSDDAGVLDFISGLAYDEIAEGCVTALSRLADKGDARAVAALESLIETYIADKTGQLDTRTVAEACRRLHAVSSGQKHIPLLKRCLMAGASRYHLQKNGYYDGDVTNALGGRRKFFWEGLPEADIYKSFNRVMSYQGTKDLPAICDSTHPDSTIMLKVIAQRIDFEDEEHMGDMGRGWTKTAVYEYRDQREMAQKALQARGVS